MRVPPIPHVRIALIGLGQRGMKTLERYAFIQGATIVCIADVDREKLELANKTLQESGRPLARTYAGTEGWKEICQQPDIDLVYICTDWSTHCQMAVTAMEAGKHVAVEVPAAETVEECWQLVNTSERTKCHCFMTENCCYDNFALATLEMKRQGLLGEITHCEGAYIHRIENLSASWMEQSCAQHGGNPYPTHGIGPIGQLLGLHRTDRMDYLVSLTSDSKNKVNSTLIRTVNGVSILLQLDVTTPRPYSRLQTVCGTKGFIQKYPLPTIQLDGEEQPTIGDEALLKAEDYFTSPTAKLWQKGHELGVPNEMNYTMDSRLIYCLQNGLPLDIDVYDAAEWSCLAELSRQSAQSGSIPVRIPDFTRGRWKDPNFNH
ncbi:MAG: Gfo/Idh/MocA family oxidoreductase [Bacteroidaceae bacterium]|nr:Gfo/Idh/MocA family oxidoreductase [Bacteroidaceae bacterium]